MEKSVYKIVSPKKYVIYEWGGGFVAGWVGGRGVKGVVGGNWGNTIRETVPPCYRVLNPCDLVICNDWESAWCGRDLALPKEESGILVSFFFFLFF